MQLEPVFSIDAPGAEGHRSSSRTDFAYQAIRQRIISGRLRIGEVFTEADFAGDLDVSKTPVREALLRLQVENLVQILPRRGYMIAPMHLSDISDLFAFRRLIEGEAVRLATEKASEQDFARITEIAEMGARAEENPTGSPEAQRDLLGRLNNAFHESIALAAHNRRLHASAVQLIREFERFYFLDVDSRTYYEATSVPHTDIARLICERRPAEAHDALMLHFHQSQEMLLSLLTSSGAGQSYAWL